MSQENVDVVAEFFAAQRDPVRFYELLDPHVVFINRPSALENRPFVGHEGIRQWVRNFRESLGDYSVEVTELIDAGGDQVVACCRFIGSGASSGVPFEGLQHSVFTLLNGKIVRCQGFDDRADALEAVGGAAGPQSSA
jgi:ketosteroid isomerase-like protein